MKQSTPGMQNKVTKMKNTKGKLRDMEFSYCFITIPEGKNKKSEDSQYLIMYKWEIL